MSSLVRLLDRPIAFHRPLVEITQSVKAALMLSQLLYWWHRRTGETVYKTRDEWWEETGLSVDEQKTAEKILVQLGLISIQRKGSPPKNHYSLNVNKLEELLQNLPSVSSRSKNFEKQETPDIQISKNRKTRDSNHGKPTIPPYTYTTTETTIARKRAERQKDPIWDAVIEACGLTGATPTKTERGAWNKAVKDLRDCGATPEEIRRRAEAYRKKWPEVSLTPTALARRWSECVAGEPSKQRAIKYPPDFWLPNGHMNPKYEGTELARTIS